MIRLFVEEPLFEGGVIYPDEKKTHYMLHVMRLTDKDEVFLFNGKDGEFKSTLEFVSKKKVCLNITQQIQEYNPTKPCVLCPAIIKKENMDLVLQKATELGVSKIIPIITQRTVVRGFNLERAKSIVAEAAEQSERLDVPYIHEPIRLMDLWSVLPEEMTPVFLTERGKTGLKPLSAIKLPAFIIGPEGGFTEKETSFLLEQKNIAPLHLGNTILRAETASIAVLGAWVWTQTEFDK